MGIMNEMKWARLVAAYRDAPGNYRNAARAAGVAKETALRAWEVGYPRQNRKPIQHMLAEEAEERLSIERARREAVQTETAAFAAALRGEVRNNQLEEYERTTQYLRAAAQTATSALMAAHKLQPVVEQLGELAPRLVERIRDVIEEGGLGAEESMLLLEKIASFTKQVGATANAATLQGAKVVEISRARAGDLQSMKEVQIHEPFDSNEAKRLAAELAEAAREVEDAAAEGPALSVVPGGVEAGV